MPQSLHALESSLGQLGLLIGALRHLVDKDGHWFSVGLQIQLESHKEIL